MRHMGTTTGRFASSRPNLSNLPRAEEPLRTFTVPGIVEPLLRLYAVPFGSAQAGRLRVSEMVWAAVQHAQSRSTAGQHQVMARLMDRWDACTAAHRLGGALALQAVLR